MLSTDCPLLVSQAFWRAVENVLGLQVKRKHQFSCDSNPKVRDFLLGLYPDMEALCSDACALAGRDALNERSSCRVLFPKCRSLWAGFPCQDVAHCNPYQISAREVILEGSRRTGSVFNAAASPRGK